MRIIGCDLHARQQTIALLDSDTGELEEKTLEHEGDTVREFYSALILVGIEATGSMQWFLEMMEELGISTQLPSADVRGASSRGSSLIGTYPITCVGNQTRIRGRDEEIGRRPPFYPGAVSPKEQLDIPARPGCLS